MFLCTGNIFPQYHLSHFDSCVVYFKSLQNQLYFLKFIIQLSYLTFQNYSLVSEEQTWGPSHSFKGCPSQISSKGINKNGISIRAILMFPACKANAMMTRIIAALSRFPTKKVCGNKSRIQINKETNPIGKINELPIPISESILVSSGFMFIVRPDQACLPFRYSVRANNMPLMIFMVFRFYYFQNMFVILRRLVQR